MFEVREALLLSLETLEMIERSSLMNRKGRECLRRFLRVLDTLGMFITLHIPQLQGYSYFFPLSSASKNEYTKRQRRNIATRRTRGLILLHVCAIHFRTGRRLHSTVKSTELFGHRFQ